MKIVSIKTTKSGEKLIANCVLDTSLIKKAFKEDGIFYLKYINKEYSSNPLNLPFAYKNVNFSIILSGGSITSKCYVIILTDEDYIKYEEYCKFDNVEFDVIFNKEEENELKSFLTRVTK